MPGANLTRIEAEERKSIIAAPIHYTVKLDLTRGAKDFGSETTITFDGSQASLTSSPTKSAKSPSTVKPSTRLKRTSTAASN